MDHAPSQHDHDAKLTTLTTLNGEIEAEMLAAELRNQGVQAQASGTLTANFRGDAPGSVHILVYEAQLEEAKAIMNDYFASREDIDWDTVDVGEGE